MNEYIASSEPKEWSKTELISFTNKTGVMAESKVSELLSEDILKLATHCGFFTHRKCKKLLKSSLSNENGYDLSAIEGDIKQYILIGNQNAGFNR